MFLSFLLEHQHEIIYVIGYYILFENALHHFLNPSATETFAHVTLNCQMLLTSCSYGYGILWVQESLSPAPHHKCLCLETSFSLSHIQYTHKK